MPPNLQIQERGPGTLVARSDPNYWLCFQRWTSCRNSNAGRIFQISVVLSQPGNLAFSWSSLRLIIVSESAKGTDDLSITDFGSQSNVEHSNADAEVDICPMQELIQYRNGLKSAMCVRGKPDEDCFTLALGMSKIEHSNPRWNFSQLRPLSSLGQKRHRILYDRVHPTDSCGRLALLTLECTNKVVANPDYLPTPRRTMYVGYPGATIHFFHISPTSSASRRAPASCLPANIVTRIANETVQCHSYGYRRQIFQLGTISRSWTPVLDLYFRLHAKFDKCQQTESGCEDEASILSVSRSLQYRPEMARLMKGFSLAFYRERQEWRSLSETQRLDALAAANKILGLLADSDSKIVQIDFHPVPEPLYHEYICALSRLTHIHLASDQVYELPLNPDDLNPSYPISIQDLQVITEKWPYLRGLTVTFGKEHQSVWRIDDEEQSRPLICNPHHLVIRSLGGEQLSGSNFRRFFETTTPQICILTLNNISGPSNRDFYLALLQTRDSLYYLSLYNSTFITSSENEEYALDQLMPDLMNIRTIHISSSYCISSKSIARKRVDAEGEKSWLFVRGANPLVTVGILEALKEGGWKGISLEQKGLENTESRQEASRIALQRGIEFSWWGS